MSVCVAAQFPSRGSRWLLSHPLSGVFLCAWFDAGAFGEETGKEFVWPEPENRGAVGGQLRQSWVSLSPCWL